MREGLHSHKAREIFLWGSEDINYKSDITDTFHLKLAALRCHESQVGHIPPQELKEWLRERHEKLAQGGGFRLAEASDQNFVKLWEGFDLSLQFVVQMGPEDVCLYRNEGRYPRWPRAISTNTWSYPMT
jgi:hypothetical protein